MAQLTHQTVRLSSGKHNSPDDGACVMELASMLGGEPFSDHPTSVCPVIGALLRRYNDTIDERRRQDLYGYAAKVVGSRGSHDVERARIIHLERWTTDLQRRRRRWFQPREGRTRGTSVREIEMAATRASREIARHGPKTHAEVLAFVDELVAIGGAAGAAAWRRTDRDALAAADAAGMVTP